MDRRKRRANRGRCEHSTSPVEVLPVGGGEKKISYCLGCGRSGPVAEGSTEALAALREASRPAFQQGSALPAPIAACLRCSGVPCPPDTRKVCRTDVRQRPLALGWRTGPSGDVMLRRIIVRGSGTRKKGRALRSEATKKSGPGQGVKEVGPRGIGPFPFPRKHTTGRRGDVHRPDGTSRENPNARLP